MQQLKVAIIGSGNIGTDLMIKVMRLSETLEMAAMAGIDAESDGLARAARMKVPTTAGGVDEAPAAPALAFALCAAACSSRESLPSPFWSSLSKSFSCGEPFASSREMKPSLFLSRSLNI